MNLSPNLIFKHISCCEMYSCTSFSLRYSTSLGAVVINTVCCSSSCPVDEFLAFQDTAEQSQAVRPSVYRQAASEAIRQIVRQPYSQKVRQFLRRLKRYHKDSQQGSQRRQNVKLTPLLLAKPNSAYTQHKLNLIPLILRISGVLLPENLHTYFELSVQAWTLYKAPQWNAHYPNSCPERIKL